MASLPISFSIIFINLSKSIGLLFPTLKILCGAQLVLGLGLLESNSGSGVAVVNGKIVENLHVEMAKNILNKVELIEKRKM